MSLRVSFELDEDDLNHFRLIMREARRVAGRHAVEEIVANAESLLSTVSGKKIPPFVAQRLGNLDVMIRMLKDHQWRLPQGDAVRVLNALAYFTESEDLIPDHVPGLGFLDDAIIIELVSRELHHEIEAYLDFCEFRRSRGPAKGVKPKTTDITRDNWLETRRRALQSRMRRRRKKQHSERKPPLDLL